MPRQTKVVPRDDLVLVQGGGFFVGKENTGQTTIILNGQHAERFLHWKGVVDPSVFKSDEGYVLGQTSGEKLTSPLGPITVAYRFVAASKNSEVVFVGANLRRKGRKSKRVVSVSNETGIGTQELTKGVDLIIKTTMPQTVFQKNIR